MRRLVLFLVLATFCSLRPAIAGNGKITGKLTDAKTKEALVGATVRIVGSSLGASSDVNGNFSILSVPPGEYKVKVTYVGYQDVTKSGVRVSSDLASELNFVMTATDVEVPAVEIIAERPMINRSATNMVRSATQEDVQNLPVRGVASAVALQPGVVMQESRGVQRLYVRGGRSDEVGYYVEGVSTRNILTGDNTTTIIPEALEEFQVYAGGYTAEYGGANAGIVRQQLRSGGSKLKATVQLETDNFDPQGGMFQYHPNNSSLNTFSYGYSDMVATLSGPVLSDKIKIFAAGENQFYRDTHQQFLTPFHFADVVDEHTNVLGQRDTIHSLDYGAGNVSGTLRNRYTFNSTLTFDLQPIILRLGTTYTWQREKINDFPIRDMFDQARLPMRDLGDGLLTLKATHFLSTKTYYEVNLNYFDQRGKTYDPLFGDDYLKYKDSLALSDLGYNTNWGYTRGPQDYSFNGFPFSRPGKQLAIYSKTKQSYIGGTFDFFSHQDVHDLKFGGSFQRYTVRGFRLGRVASQNGTVSSVADREALLSTMMGSPDLFRNAGAYDPLTEDYARDVYYRNAGDYINAYGYDVYGNEANSGFDGPKHPQFAAAYFMDKVELSDIVLNAGLRLDIIDTDDRQFRDFIDVAGTYGSPGTHYGPSNPLQTATNEIIPAGMEHKPAWKQVSPRLGFSFPVTDRTQFHIQYGKFLQAPNLNTIFAGRGVSAVSFSGSYFVPSPVGYGLDPERTTQYEVGFMQQFSDNAVVDITGFYKDIQGQIQFAKINTDPNAVAQSYNTLQNGDYATTKGLEIRLTMRRVSRVQAQLNYTLSDAQGTGSTAYSAVAGIELGTPRPTVISPLDFNQTHRGTINIDYRFAENDGGSILSRLGANILLSFNSGHNFTRVTGSIGQRDAYLGGILADDDPRTRKPIESINASTTPWVYTLDLRLDKTMNITDAIAVNIYLYVQNLLNTQNVVNVYGRTGNAYDDGFLTTPSLSQDIVNNRGQQFVDFYKAINLGNRQHYALTQGGDLFGSPRQLRVGLRLEY